MSKQQALPNMPAQGPRGRQSEDRFCDSIMYTFFAPRVAWPGYEDDFKDKWMEITAQRVKHQKEVFQQEQCTEFEAMLYLSTATLAAPPTHDWGQIYFWLFQRYQPEIAEANDIGPDRPDLNAQQQEKLTGLRRWVFRRQMEHLKGKTKGKQSPTKPAAGKSDVEVIQERMF